MNILFDIGHPAHVHMFKYSISQLKKNGHKVIVTVKEIPSAIELLKSFNIEYISIGRKFDSIVLKGFSQFKYDFNLYKVAKRQNIDIAVGSSITITHVSRFHKMKSIILDDDDNEAVRLFVNFAHPFADWILSPSALAHQRNGKKDITYDGTHEIMYLHPSLFKPNSEVLKEVGLKDGDPFFILRFVAVKAYHDKGQEGLNVKQKLELIDVLKPFGRIFITTEREIEPELKQYQLKVSSENIHHLLFFAKMFVGDSQTMTSEAAILGTPALKCNSFAGKLSIPNELEEKYDLCYSYQPFDFEELINKVSDLIELPDIKKDWSKKVDRLFNDKINVSDYLLWLIENFPESINTIKENPDYQYNFK